MGQEHVVMSVIPRITFSASRLAVVASPLREDQFSKIPLAGSSTTRRGSNFPTTSPGAVGCSLIFVGIWMSSSALYRLGQGACDPIKFL